MEFNNEIIFCNNCKGNLGIRIIKIVEMKQKNNNTKYLDVT